MNIRESLIEKYPIGRTFANTFFLSNFFPNKVFSFFPSMNTANGIRFLQPLFNDKFNKNMVCKIGLESQKI